MRYDCPSVAPMTPARRAVVARYHRADKRARAWRLPVPLGAGARWHGHGWLSLLAIAGSGLFSVLLVLSVRRW